MSRRRHLGYSTLTALAAVDRGYRYGFDIMDATGLHSGTVYRALSRLEELSYVRSRWEPSSVALKEKRPRRRYYVVTEAGVRELTDARRRFRLVDELRPAPVGETEAPIAKDKS